jgi:hypothetical protein
MCKPEQASICGWHYFHAQMHITGLDCVLARHAYSFTISIISFMHTCYDNVKQLIIWWYCDLQNIRTRAMVFNRFWVGNWCKNPFKNVARVSFILQVEKKPHMRQSKGDALYTLGPCRPIFYIPNEMNATLAACAQGSCWHADCGSIVFGALINA